MSACLMLHQLVCTHILFYKPYAPGSVACREGIEDVVLSNLNLNLNFWVRSLAMLHAGKALRTWFCCMQGGH
jgi:hypothetical protein